MKNITVSIVAILMVSTVAYTQLPDPGFTVDENTAIVITDPQNDFLSQNCCLK